MPLFASQDAEAERFAADASAGTVSKANKAFDFVSMANSFG